MLRSQRPNFVRSFAFGGTRSTEFSKHCLRHRLLCHILLVGWWMGHVFLVLWSEVEDSLPVFCIRSLTNGSPNFQCDNFELRREKMIKMFEMVWSRRWKKNGFFVHLHVRLRLKTAFLPFVLGLSPMPVQIFSAIILNYEGKNDKNI
jgi:hypothetical protein